MSWNNDTDFKVIFTDGAKKHLNNIIDYLFSELDNAQAACNVEQDMKETTRMLSHVAGSLKLCDNPKLNALGYRTIHTPSVFYTLQDHSWYSSYRWRLP